MKIELANIHAIENFANLTLPQSKIPGVVEWSSDSRTLYIGGNRGLWTIKVSGLHRSASPVFHEFPASIIALALSPANEKLLACGLEDGSICLWNVEKERIVASIRGHEELVTQVLFDASQQSLFSLASGGEKILVWDVIINQKTRSINSPLYKDLTCFDINRAATIIVTGSHNGQVTVSEAVGSEIKIHALSSISRSVITQLVLSPDERWLSVGNLDGDLELWTAADWQRQASTQHQEGIVSLSFNADSQILASLGLDGRINLWNSELINLRSLSLIGWPPSTVSFSRDGSMLVATSEDGSIQLSGLPE